MQISVSSRTGRTAYGNPVSGRKSELVFLVNAPFGAERSVMEGEDKKSTLVRTQMLLTETHAAICTAGEGPRILQESGCEEQKP